MQSTVRYDANTTQNPLTPSNASFWCRLGSLQGTLRETYTRLALQNLNDYPSLRRSPCLIPVRFKRNCVNRQTRGPNTNNPPTLTTASGTNELTAHKLQRVGLNEFSKCCCRGQNCLRTCREDDMHDNIRQPYSTFLKKQIGCWMKYSSNPYKD